MDPGKNAGHRGGSCETTHDPQRTRPFRPATRSRRVRPPQSEPPRLYFIADERIRTPEAAVDATRIAGQIDERDPRVDATEETVLFQALQTCAYRSSGNGEGARASLSARWRWAKRWRTIRDHLVERNIGLVYRMMRQFSGCHLDLDELTSDGMLAYIRAVEQFNPFRGFRFSTYACNVVLRAAGRRRYYQMKYRRRFPVAVNDALDGHAGPEADLDSELFLDRLCRILRGNSAALTDMESHVLKRRFSLDNGPALTLLEIGREIELSKERIRQIQNHALAKLRDALYADPVLQ